MVVISDDDEEVDSDNGVGSRDESLNLESYVSDSEVDSMDKINAWVTRVGKHAFAIICSFHCMLPKPSGGPSITNFGHFFFLLFMIADFYNPLLRLELSNTGLVTCPFVKYFIDGLVRFTYATCGVFVLCFFLLFQPT